MGKLAITNQARRDSRAAMARRPLGTPIGSTGPDAAAAAALGDFNEAMRRCSRCGVEDFDQIPVRRHLEA